MLFLKYKKLSEYAIEPRRATLGAAGYDVCAAHDSIIKSKGRMLVKTDLAIAVPIGTYGRIAPRSGLTLKHGIDVGAGVIDEDYRGNVGVILFNHGDDDFEIKKGDRIAQLILESIKIVEVQECDSLDGTNRGDGGYGSTGYGSTGYGSTGYGSTGNGNTEQLKNAFDSGC